MFFSFGLSKLAPFLLVNCAIFVLQVTGFAWYISHMSSPFVTVILPDFLWNNYMTRCQFFTKNA